jgi:hypothetical protein
MEDPDQCIFILFFKIIIAIFRYHKNQA